MCEAATPLLTIDVDFEKNRGPGSGSPCACQDICKGVHDNVPLPLLTQSTIAEGNECHDVLY